MVTYGTLLYRCRQNRLYVFPVKSTPCTMFSLLPFKAKICRTGYACYFVTTPGESFCLGKFRALSFAATVSNQAISSVPSQKRLRSLPTAAHSQYRAPGHKCPAVPGRKRPALTAPLREGLVRIKLSGSWLEPSRARDEIGETYQMGPASPGIGDSAIYSNLTPEHRLLCPSAWRTGCALLASLKTDFDLVRNERGIVIRTLRITLLSDSGYALTGYEY
jgi:hypothetical protein